jgi:aspartate carbamoyltransferase regulatory subunit
MSTKTLSVAAIQHGTVIDHIPAKRALPMIRILHLIGHKAPITVGFNLSSQYLGLKDIIKIENHELTLQEREEIAIFAPDATVNIIRDYKIVEKLNLPLPQKITGFLACANGNCITQTEKVKSHFSIMALGKTIEVRCHYCETVFPAHSLGDILA